MSDFVINPATMHKVNFPTVHNVAPPSYSQAMAQSTTNIPASTQFQSTHPQEHSQSFNYPSSATVHPYPSNSYSSMPVQSHYNQAYVSSNQQNQPTPYVINATVVPLDETADAGRNKKRGLGIMCVFIIWFIVIISIFTSIFK